MILFNKYMVETSIYESEVSSVYLVRHVSMSERRIVKRILKKSVYKENFFSELNILKSIKNPHIPIVYDTEEDEKYYYIIEEYIEGITLSDYIKKNGCVNEKRVINIGIKLGEIISFLHNSRPSPVLYLDIQPGNVILKDEEVYLIDFGNSHYLGEIAEVPMGTKGFCAPEQYSRVRCTTGTDIFSIGALLYYMLTGKTVSPFSDSMESALVQCKISEKLKVLILQCISGNKNERPENIDAVVFKLKELEKNKNISDDHGNKSLKISIAGMDRRMGVTHIAMKLVKTFMDMGVNTFYDECNDSGQLRLMADWEKMDYKEGYFVKNGLYMRPRYGKLINIEPRADVIVRDEGVIKENMTDSDVFIIILGAKSWEIDCSVSAYKRIKQYIDKDKRIILLCNLSTYKESRMLWSAIGDTGYVVPYINSPFCGEKTQFFKELCSDICKDGGICKSEKEKFLLRNKKKRKTDSHRNYGNTQR